MEDAKVDVKHEWFVKVKGKYVYLKETGPSIVVFSKFSHDAFLFKDKEDAIKAANEVNCEVIERITKTTTEVSEKIIA